MESAPTKAYVLTVGIKVVRVIPGVLPLSPVDGLQEADKPRTQSTSVHTYMKMVKNPKGSGCTDHPCLDIGSKEHNTFHKRIMMPIDHLNLQRGEFNGVARMNAHKSGKKELHCMRAKRRMPQLENISSKRRSGGKNIKGGMGKVTPHQQGRLMQDAQQPFSVKDGGIGFGLNMHEGWKTSAGFLRSITARGPYSAARSKWAGPTLRLQMLANLSEGTGVPSVCLWSRSRSGSMGKGSHRRGSTPADSGGPAAPVLPVAVEDGVD
ncbi:hypothetical protein EYF80_000839 [Liparis tanakae]|uniref:Uncharacterized protein n=1 Tax=Liparis tanakae TaxID=230148 RepID=A0A4Z2JG67_9TELE|nr:hypothetical protein EYF80_000839 [Liparis tanakae]